MRQVTSFPYLMKISTPVPPIPDRDTNPKIQGSRTSYQNKTKFQYNLNSVARNSFAHPTKIDDKNLKKNR